MSSTIYDQLSNLAQTVDPHGYRTVYDYDLRGNVTAVHTQDDLSESDPEEWPTVSYEYDLADRLTQTIDAVGLTTETSYDDLGRVEEIRQLATSGNLVTSYEYDARGRVVKQTNPDDSYSTFAYDHLGRPVASTDPLGVTIESSGNQPSASPCWD